MLHPYLFVSTFVLILLGTVNYFLIMYGKTPIYRSKIVDNFLNKVISIFVFATLIAYVFNL